jgi:predicted glutamine amidotransferase
MCRLLFVESDEPFDIASHLSPFAQISRDSKEYQGHGWGCSWMENERWNTYKSVRPIWEDHFEIFGKTTRLVAHARSAFKNEGIMVENNMPFENPPWIFIFNGELHGVRIREEGRIGAEKIFNLIRRLDRGDMLSALRKAVDVIQKRTRYVRAMNIVVVSDTRAYVASVSNEDPDYFTLHVRKKDGIRILCSEPYPGEVGWERIQNHSIKELFL